ncbi:MAG: carboxypeptidase regulatory-like domain-containing protein, partial [Lentimicrobium sp.]|nr:carboxypeptidase regulatory-like domain-containing protein [Lentimicrobium sp.]
MYVKTTFLRWLGSLMMTVMLLFGTAQLMAQASLTITPQVLNLGDRPIGAWMEPLTVTLENTSPVTLFITNIETDNPEAFGLDLPFLPLTIAAGATADFGVFLQSNVPAGNVTGQIAILFDGSRNVVFAPVSANAYTPVEGDVYEDPFLVAGFPVNLSGVSTAGFVNNYTLAGPVTDGFDAVYSFSLASDQLVSVNLTAANAKMAIYEADFAPNDGPRAGNEIYAAEGVATNLEMFAGDYFLVVSTTGATFDLNITAVAMPSADAAVYVAPADGATDIINGMELEWTFGANTLEYQVILGTTYPPANVVVDWTSAITETLSPLEGTWKVANEPGSFGVGPVQGDMSWWSIPAGELAARACFFDDKYVFNADGSFQNVMDGLTFLEPWQGGWYNCGTPVAPHDGSADATYDYNASAGTITLNGVGAYLGIPKVYNGGELSNPNNAPSSITYLASFTDGGNTMILDISIGGGWWRYKMVKEASVPGAYTLANLQPNLQYFWQVNTRNNNGTTINPEIWGFTTTLNPPTGLNGNAEVYEGEDVVLSWESPVNRAFLGYNVYRDGVMINSTMITQTAYTDAAPAYNMAGYNYNVTSIYDEGESGFSATFTARVTGEGTLNGHVSDLNTGDDIAGATVTMTGVDEFGEMQSYSTTTNANGNYTADVFAGTYNISVAANGYISAEETGIAVAYGATQTTDFMLFETAYPVAVVTASVFGENILIQYSFDPAANARALVEFQIWRKKSYLPGAMEMIGTTSQMQFVDFGWSMQDWGVYKWYVVAVYDLNQSDPVASNPIDKDMFTMVDVTAVLNSADSPAGTSVVFTNVDESPELTYATTLGADGIYTWDSFRKGTYDIEVSLPGYGTISETGVDIFDETSFSWLLVETLATPASLYVTPTGLASWSSASPLEGTWMVANEPGSFGVGPVQGDMSWWSVPAGELAARACFFDDKYIFNADGSFQNVMDGLTFLEPWQGGWYNCGTPVAPHDGSADATYEYNESAGTITLNGIGAYLGIPKVYNGGELNNPNNAPSSITYLAQLTDGGNTMILDISIGGGWWRFKMVKEGFSNRSLETYKIFLDGILIGEQSENVYQHGGFGETLVDGETYTTGVAAVFTTGQSATAEFTWKYVACDNYATPEAFVAEQVIGSLDINLTWTNVDAAALDTISALRIYRNGQTYTELDFTTGSVSSFLDESLEFGTYSYCLTYIYDSGAESCSEAVCSDAVTITGGGFVNGTVTAFDGGAAIAGATVIVSNSNFSFAFTTNAAGFYQGEVVGGTYNYLVEANSFESQTLEAVAVPFGATVTNDFALLEFPYAATDVVATELSGNVVQVVWNANGGVPNGFSIYRTTCETGDLQFLGYTLDEQFTDNTWGSVDAGVYKWGVVAEYDNNASGIAFSNCLDKDMITQVSVTVSTNSQDSPAGTIVLFANTSEPDLGLVYETTLNASGYFIWNEFRKGTYDISVNKAGFEPINLAGYLIESPENFVWLLQEQLLPVTDLYVNPAGFASWGGVGGPASPLQGTWQVAAELGSMGVGPAQGDMSWWSVGGIDLEVRSCFWDDRYIFRADGSFDNELDDLTFLEPWQGVNYECGIPVAPHDGSANATFDFDEVAGTITLNGVGAFLGLPKVYNGGELINPNDAPASITYLFELTDDGNTMIVDINANGAWWRFKMVKADNAATRELQNYKVWLDGVFMTDTENTFYQYNTENLVAGQDYLAEVAAVYSTGMSAKMSYVWTYYPCETFAGPVQVTGE